MIKPIRFSICRTLLLVLIFSSAALASERDFCSSSNAFSLGEHAPKPSLGIRLFELNVRPEFPMRIMEHLRIYLAENLRARLSESQYFGSVSVLAEDSEKATDFTMIGGFTQASIGTDQFNLYNILTQQALDTASAISIVGGILRAKDTDPVTTFQCRVWCCKPLVAQGVGVVPRHTGEGKMEASISTIAQYLKGVYSKKLKLQQRVEQ